MLRRSWEIVDSLLGFRGVLWYIIIVIQVQETRTGMKLDKSGAHTAPIRWPIFPGGTYPSCDQIRHTMIDWRSPCPSPRNLSTVMVITGKVSESLLLFV